VLDQLFRREVREFLFVPDFAQLPSQLAFQTRTSEKPDAGLARNRERARDALAQYFLDPLLRDGAFRVVGHDRRAAHGDAFGEPLNQTVEPSGREQLKIHGRQDTPTRSDPGDVERHTMPWGGTPGMTDGYPRGAHIYLYTYITNSYRLKKKSAYPLL